MIAMFFEDQKSRCLWKSCGEVFIWLISSMFWGQASAWAHTREGWPSSGSRIGFFWISLRSGRVSPIETLKTGLARSLFGSSGGGGYLREKNQTAFNKIIKHDGFWTWFFGATCLILPLQEVVSFHWCFLQACRHCCGALQTWPSVLIGGQECFKAVSLFLEEFGEQKKETFFGYWRYMLNIRSSEGSTKMGVCVCVSLCVFLLDMSFFSRCEKGCFFCARCRRGVGSATKNCLLLKSRWTFPWLASTQAAQLRVRVKVAEHLVSTGWKVQMCGEVHQVHANQYEKYEKCDVSYILWFWYDVLDFFGTYNSTV